MKNPSYLGQHDPLSTNYLFIEAKDALEDNNEEEVRKYLMFLHRCTPNNLSINFHQCSARSYKFFGNYLEKNNFLTDLKLCYGKMEAPEMKLLLQRLPQDTKLSAISFKTTKISQSGINYLTVFLRSYTAISKLELTHNKLNSEMVRDLLHHLGANTTITNLNLSGNLIGSNGLGHISNYLKCNSVINILSINNIFPQNKSPCDKAIKYFSQALNDNNSLTKLNCKSNKLGVSGLNIITNALKFNTKLTSLDFSSNCIGKRGAEYLGEMLKNNSCITQLHLSVNNIGKSGFKYFEQVLRVNTSLKILNLYNNSLYYESIKGIKLEHIQYNPTKKPCQYYYTLNNHRNDVYIII